MHLKNLKFGLVYCFISLAAVLGNGAIAILLDFQGTHEEHEVLVRDLANVVAEQTTRSILQADLALRQIEAIIVEAGGLEAANDHDTWVQINRVAAHVHGRVAVLALRPDGQVAVSSEQTPPPGISLAERPFMKNLRDRDLLDIGPAVPSKLIDGTTIYTVNRRLTGPSGEMLGVLSAGVRTSYLTDFYDLLSFRKSPLVSVYNLDGDLVARNPNVAAHVGANIGRTDFFAHILAASEGTITDRSPVDQIERLFAFKVIPQFDLVVVTGIERAVINGAWMERAMHTGLATLIGLVLVAATSLWGLRMVRHERRQQGELELAVRLRREADAARDAARRDGLTRLASRALFEELVEDVRGRVTDDGLHLAVMLVDLDGFKAVNDTWGHARGDEILVAAAHVLRGAVRDSDVVGRLGGDEFAVCIVAPHDAIAGRARTIAARIVENMGQIGLSVGCSVGIALFPPKCSSLTCVLGKADEAMYWAKSQGKGRFSVWGSEDPGKAWVASKPGCVCVGQQQPSSSEPTAAASS